MRDNFWATFVDNQISEIENEGILGKSAATLYLVLNRIKSEQVNNHDWFNVLVKYSEGYIKSYQKIDITFYLNMILGEHPECFQKFMYRTETKKYPKELRESLYTKLISAGFLDTKLARRIRSDTSSHLSKKLLTVLFESKSKYSDEDFQNLLTQFTDTQHRWVAQFIAVNIPLRLSPFLMGLNDANALLILDKRLAADE